MLHFTVKAMPPPLLALSFCTVAARYLTAWCLCGKPVQYDELGADFYVQGWFFSLFYLQYVILHYTKMTPSVR